MSRILIAVVIAIAIYLAFSQQAAVFKTTYFNVIDNCGNRDYAILVDRLLYEAYRKYTEMFGKPPAFSGKVVIRPLDRYAGLAYVLCNSYGCYVSEIHIACNLRDVEVTAYHEMAHAMQATFMTWSGEYGWWIESSAEGLTVYALQRPTSIYMRFFYYEMWKKDPYKSDGLEIYYYAPAMTFLLTHFDKVDVFSAFSDSRHSKIVDYYTKFLLSPWNWTNIPGGREPSYDVCSYTELDRLTAYFCEIYADRVAVYSNVYVNGTKSGDKIKLAFVAPYATTLSYSITVPRVNTVTTTVTTTVTHTTTSYVTVTDVRTVYVTVTDVKTVTDVRYETITTTVTYVKTVTDIVTKTVTDTITKTVTDTVTKTVIQNVTKTVTDTVTKTVTTIDTVTKTVTDTVTHTVTHTEVAYARFDFTVAALLIIVAIILFVLAVMICRRG